MVVAIDIDFAPEDRTKVYKWIINRLTPSKTSYIAQFGTLKDRGTIETIARGLGWNNDKPVMMEIKKRYEDVFSDYKSILEYNIDFDSLPDEYKTIDFDHHQYYISKVNFVTEKKLNECQERFNSFILEYPDIAFYFKGIKGTIKSKGSHPAGIIGSPITLPDNLGVFYKDGDLDMPVAVCEMKAVDYLNFVKFDILGLKTIGIMKDVYQYINSPYLKSNEIDWFDSNVWNNMIESKLGVFQFEGQYAFDLLKKFEPQKINDMSLVNAAIRPSGNSYRDKLINKEINVNPSEEIDQLLQDNYGYLVYQEDTIKFLTKVCGMSGSMADTTRRAIGKKDLKLLKQQLPLIIEGYCANCNKPRETAEQEVNQFIKIISDSSDYQFGYNHSTGYSMNGYACVRLRTYYPLEFITAYLNRADNEEDIVNGTQFANEQNITINMPVFGFSNYLYTFDKKSNSVYKGLKSVKYINESASQHLYELGQKFYCNFLDLLIDIGNSSIDKRQLEILIKLKFFGEYGNNQKLLNFLFLFNELYYSKSIKQNKYQDNEEVSNLVPFSVLFKLLEDNSKKTDKTFKDIDNEKILLSIWNLLEDKKIRFQDQGKFEIEYLGYVQSTEVIDETFYFVTEQYFSKNPNKPYLTLYNIRNGNYQKMRITNDKFYGEKKFNQYAIIRVVKISFEPTNVKVEGEWKKSKTETETILLDWVVCYNENINEIEKKEKKTKIKTKDKNKEKTEEKVII